MFAHVILLLLLFVFLVLNFEHVFNLILSDDKQLQFWATVKAKLCLQLRRIPLYLFRTIEIFLIMIIRPGLILIFWVLSKAYCTTLPWQKIRLFPNASHLNLVEVRLNYDKMLLLLLLITLTINLLFSNDWAETKNQDTETKTNVTSFTVRTSDGIL